MLHYRAVLRSNTFTIVVLIAEPTLKLRSLGSFTYKSAKRPVPILKSLASNEYTVKGSFAFAEEIVEQDSQFFMVRLILY